MGDFSKDDYRGRVVPVGKSALDVAFDGRNIWTLAPAESRVVVLDAVSGGRITEFDVPDGGVKLVFDGERMWLISKAQIAVAYDPATFKEVARWSTPFVAINASFAHGQLWLVNENGESVAALLGDGVVDTEVHRGYGTTAPILAGGELFIGEKDYVSRVVGSGAVTVAAVNSLPVALAFDGEYLWSVQMDGTLAKIDPLTLTLITQVVTGCNSPRDMQFDGRYLFISCAGDKALVRVDPQSAETPHVSMFVGSDPEGLSFDGIHIWIAINAEGTVRKLRPS